MLSKLVVNKTKAWNFTSKKIVLHEQVFLIRILLKLMKNWNA